MIKKKNEKKSQFSFLKGDVQSIERQSFKCLNNKIKIENEMCCSID